MAALLVMTSIHGRLFDTPKAQTAETLRWVGRPVPLQGQFVFDAYTSLDVPDNYAQRGADLQIGGMNPNPTVTPDLLHFENYVRQMYLNSDTTVSVLSAGSPFDPFSAQGTDTSWEFLNNEALAQAAEMVNETAGRSVMLAHAVITPGKKGWVDKVNDALKKKELPAGWTLYDCQFPLDDKRLNWFYDKAAQTGIVNLGISGGSTPRNLVRTAQNRPKLNFILYGDDCLYSERPDNVLADFENTGFIEWCPDLSEIPPEDSPSNIYVVTGAAFASTVVTNPRLTAALLGTWIKRLGHSNVLWGTGSFNGSPQWQIEALRRLEIPEDMQEKFGFDPLGPADSLVKRNILGLNAAELYKPRGR